MNVTIIGVAGFLGKALAKNLAKAGYSVTGYDIVKPTYLADNIKFQLVDVLIDDFKFSSDTNVIFYLAQSPYYRDFPKNADHLFGVNAFGAIKAAKAALDEGVKFFCYASTGSVYAPSFSPCREGDPVRRDDAYVLSKLMVEEALDLYHGSMAIMSARLFGLFGPGQKDMLPAKIFEAVQSGKEIYLESSPVDPEDDGGLKVSLLYVSDATRCLTRLAEMAIQGASLPCRLNVAGPEPISIRRLAETVGQIVGTRPHFTVTERARKLDLIADINLLQELIKPTFTSFKEAITRTLTTQ
jgi:nucleoside-diphosphate-sugar epimerase